MGWEKRGKNQYYYRKRWENGQIISEYIGTGPLAEVWADRTTMERQELAAEREAWQSMVTAERKIDHALTEIATILNTLISVVLVANGYYAHHRQWRRARGE